MKLKQKLTTRYTRARLNILSLVSLRKSAVKAFRLFCRPGKRQKGKPPAIFETGEPLSFRLDGHTIRGHRWQPYSDALRPTEESVKKVLLVHGFGSSSRIFDHYIAALLKKGYEVIAFDAPGHGESGGKRIFISDYVRILAHIEQSHGPFQSWLAHALGGLALVLSLEDAVPDRSCALTLIAPAPGIAQAVEDWAVRHRLSAEVVREMGEYITEIGGHPLAWYSLRRAIGSVGAEVLYVQDEEDTVVPPNEAKLIRQDGHPNVRFLFTTGLGHKKVYKDQEVLDKVVAFL
jgi:pimeloyl-ACP methyl ester carboxylesterase